jgi:hypothetical protein
VIRQGESPPLPINNKKDGVIPIGAKRNEGSPSSTMILKGMKIPLFSLAPAFMPELTKPGYAYLK